MFRGSVMSRFSKKLLAIAIKRSIIILSSRDYLLVPPPKIGKNDEKIVEKPEKEKKVKVKS